MTRIREGKADVSPAELLAPEPDAAPPARESRSITVPAASAEPLGVYARFGKPLFDLVLLVLVLPPGLVLGGLVALLNGCLFGDLREIFFVQERVGRAGRPFRIFKFRTMRDDPGAEDGARVTRFGRFLRSTHLDELPQLLNVLRGEMSFIGPRPEMLDLHEWAVRNVPGFERRLVVKPGITGLSQVTQGYTAQDPEAYERKLSGDEEYLASISLGRDLEILGLTAVWMLRARGWAPSQRPS